MSGYNLPPGVSLSDIPGNERWRLDAERWLEENTYSPLMIEEFLDDGSIHDGSEYVLRLPRRALEKLVAALGDEYEDWLWEQACDWAKERSGC